MHNVQVEKSKIEVILWFHYLNFSMVCPLQYFFLYFTGDEMFTDTYKYELIDDHFYRVVGKSVTYTEGNN